MRIILSSSPVLWVTAWLVLAVSCGSAGYADPAGDRSGPSSNVVVTTSIWADVLNNIDCVSPPTWEPIIPAGTDPHDFQVSIPTAERVEGADMIVANGGGLEASLAPLIDSAEADGVAVIRAVEMTSSGDDPHLWMDPQLVIEVATELSVALIDNGFEAGEIASCLDEYLDELAALDNEIAELANELPPDRRRLVTNHDAVGPFAARYGFEIVGTVLPSSTLAQANPADLEALEQIIREHGIPAVFTERGQSSAAAEALAERLGIPVVGLHIDALGPPESEVATYIDLMRFNASQIVAALATGQP